MFGNISQLLSMEGCAPFVFLGSWALVAPYLCFRFCIFDRPMYQQKILVVKFDMSLKGLE